ncbi:NAD-dependent epimerase/dehydratase family protein [Agromyces protaetiae]|uniref:NAD-dependent epimerase/dehydratase family protein n=1 Tax=Agromyces protaetiae TaxID=2509455 RepID=UPI0013EDDF24|nr:NAD-dependent epimerase/dehydratase family protein [Agromyces protaetiae]
MPRSLVIGANGFIGVHLVEGLRRAGHEVTAFDRFSAGPRFGVDGVRIVRGEFLDRSALAGALDGQDFVFHFVSTTTPATAEGDPTLDVRTNIAQSVDLLTLAVEARVRHVYFASTGGAVYGPQGRDSYAEDTPALPVSPYAIGKLTIEHYLRYFRHKHGLQSTALRISNPYGPGQHARRGQGLIPIALDRIIRDEEVVQFGDGSMIRDYLYVEDLVAMILRIVAAPIREHEVYNLGSGVGQSVSETLATLREVTGIDFPVRVVPVPTTFVDRVVLDTARFRREFGELELMPFEEGVRRTYEEARDAR